MEQIIYIEQNDKNEATKLSKVFVEQELNARTYVNALGAELAMKYFAQIGINTTNIYNIHCISKFREEFDIADVMLPNIHIDVRMVYNSDEIFIPKSHFEYNLIPDIYLVFEYTNDPTYATLLGYFEPKLINKQNQNDKYYFIPRENLLDIDSLKSFIENYSGNTTQYLEDNEMELGQQLAISMIDNEISSDKKIKLINLLKKSSTLRQDLIEFDNFELVSLHAAQTEDFQNPDFEVDQLPALENIDEFDMFDTPFQEEFQEETTELILESNIDNLELEPIESLETLEIDEDTEIKDQESLNEIEQDPLEELQPIETLEIDEDTEIQDEESSNEIDQDSLEEIQPIENLEIDEDTEIKDEESSDEIDQDSLEETVATNTDESLNNEDDETITKLEDIASLFGDTDFENKTEDEEEEESNMINISKIEASNAIEDEIPLNNSYENSTIITNSNSSVGEIPIDINETINTKQNNDNFNIAISQQEKGKKAILISAIVATILTAVVTFSLFSKKPAEENIVEDYPENSTNEIAMDNIENSIEDLDPTIAKTLPTEIIEKDKNEVIEKAIPKGPAIETPYLEVKKISWGIPEYLSYNDTFRNYLMSTGKSIKLSLSSDLLLATEYAYSNKIEVNTEISKNGTVQGVNILKSSGSKEIDDIVLRTVKSTLNVLKVPSDSIIGDNLHLTLIISL